MRRPALDHLCDGVQHPGGRTEWRVGLFRAADAIEVAEELVGAVDQMDNHSREELVCSGAVIRTSERLREPSSRTSERQRAQIRDPASFRRAAKDTGLPLSRERRKTTLG